MKFTVAANPEKRGGKASSVPAIPEALAGEMQGALVMDRDPKYISSNWAPFSLELAMAHVSGRVDLVSRKQISIGTHGNHIDHVAEDHSRKNKWGIASGKVARRVHRFTGTASVYNFALADSPRVPILWSLVPSCVELKHTLRMTRAFHYGSDEKGEHIGQGGGALRSFIQEKGFRGTSAICEQIP